MLMPRIFDDDFFDDWMRWPVSRSLADTEKQLYGKHAPHVMRTDIHEHDDHYDVDIDLPGFKKDEIELMTAGTPTVELKFRLLDWLAELFTK